LLVLLVTDVLGGTELAFGLVTAAGATGGLIGSLTGASFIRAFGRRVALVAPFVLMILAMLTVSLVSGVILAGAGAFLVLFAVGLFNVCAQSIRQRMTPDRLLGRVVAGMRFFSMGAVPLGALGGGLVARFIEVQQTMLVAALVCVVGLAVIVASTSRQDLEARSTI
jgi:MFS family permease